MKSPHYNDNVFLNCPFDSAYKRLFDAMVFAVHDCGFIPRCALEEEDASQVRIDKIYNIIADCRYGIHDISRTELDQTSGFPRFNMPLELGVFFLGQRNLAQTNKKGKIALYWIKSSIGINSLSQILRGKIFSLITTILKKSSQWCGIGSATHRSVGQFQVAASLGNITKSLWGICPNWLKSIN